MITALLLTKSWDAAQAKYPILNHEVTLAHVEEGITDLDPTELVVEKQALQYDTDFLCRIILVTGEDLDDSGSDSIGTTTTDDNEFNIDQVEDISSLLSSPSRSWASPATPSISMSFQRTILQDHAPTPSLSTPPQGDKHRASGSINLTSSMVNRFWKNL